MKLMPYTQDLTHADSAHTHVHSPIEHTCMHVCSSYRLKFKKVPAQGMLYCLDSNIHSVSTT